MEDASPPPLSNERETFIDQLRALASKESMDILGVLAESKPTPVPVHAITEKLQLPQSTVSTHLAKLRKVQLIKAAGNRRRGYFADTAQLKAVIGERSYTRITQELYPQDLCQNENAPGQSQG